MTGSIPTSWSPSFRARRQPKLTNPAGNPRHTTTNPRPELRGLTRTQSRCAKKKTRSSSPAITPGVQKITRPGRSGAAGVYMPAPSMPAPTEYIIHRESPSIIFARNTLFNVPKSASSVVLRDKSVPAPPRTVTNVLAKARFLAQSSPPAKTWAMYHRTHSRVRFSCSVAQTKSHTVGTLTSINEIANDAPRAASRSGANSGQGLLRFQSECTGEKHHFFGAVGGHLAPGERERPMDRCNSK